MSEFIETAKSSRPRTAIKPPTPKAPLIDTSKLSPSTSLMADVVNNAAAPFQEAPDPKKGTAGEIEHVIGAVMGVVGAPFELLDTGFALATAPLAALMPGFPAAVLYMPHLGTMHGHAHPPSLIPPNPVPTPLPSIGTVVGAGCVSVTIGGVIAARAGDLGLALTCFSFGPPFEIYTGSSNTWIGGSRAARMLDITRHCNPASKLSLLGAAMGAVGVVAGAVGSQASSNAGQALQASMQAAQAAADALALAMSALIGIDPGLPTPATGAILLGNPTVLIGGFPVPDLLDLLGGALKGLKKLGDTLNKLPAVKKLLAKLGLCNDPGEPVSTFSGAVYNDFEDYRAANGFTWERHYKSGWNDSDGPLGHGFRHFYERRLQLLRKRALYETHDGEQVSIPRDDQSGFLSGEGFTLTHLAAGRYRLLTDRDEELEFVEQPTSPPSGRLVRYARRALELHLDYDDRGRLRTLTEAAGAFAVHTRLIYGDDGRISEVQRGPRESAPQVISRYGYENGCLVRWQDALGATAHLRYDAARRMVQGTDRRGYSFHWHYDSSGRCIKSQGDDGLWGVEARYEGFTSFFKEADGGEWTFKHFPDGLVSHVLDPQGGMLEYVRNKPTGRIVEQITPGGTKYRWLYDREGKHYARADQWAHQLLPEDLDPEPRDPLVHDGPLTHKAWLWGRPLELLSEPVAGLPALISHALERFGPFTLALPAPSPAPVCDALGHVIEQPFADGAVCRFQRDGEGNVVAEQDVHGNWSRREITSWNLVAKETSPLGNSTEYTYTHWEKWRTVEDPNHNRTEYVRDARHRVRELHRHGRLYRRYSYDAHDALIEEREGDGNLVVRCETGKHGLPMSRALGSGETYTYDYDTHGRPTRASPREHDVELGHLRELRRLDRRDGKGVEHVYECWLGVIRTTYFGRFVVQYRYQGAPGVRIETPDGSQHRLWRSGRNLVVRENGNGRSEATVFDSEERLCARACWNRQLALDGPSWLERYQYSAHGELTTWSDRNKGSTSFEYDPDHRLIAQTDRRGRRPYSYDRAGNLTRTPGFGLIEHTAGNLIQHADFDHFEHDASYRRQRALRFQRPDITYRYDSLGQLVEARFSDRDEVWRAAYDGLGRRLWRELGGARTDFYWDGDRLAAERSPGGELRLYIYVNEDALVPFMWLDYPSEDADPASGKAYYLFAAPNGLPLRVEDAHRQIVWEVESLDAYGLIELKPRAQVKLRLRFAGHFYDEDLGLFYNRFRDYDPHLGRYLQPDPIGHDGSINLYAYPANPLVDVDLRGLVHRKGPAGEGPEQTKALQDAVEEEVKRQQRELPNRDARERALMVGGVRNKKTGDIDMATNRDAQATAMDDLHPVVRDRVKTQDDIVDVHQKLINGDPPNVAPKTTKEIHDMTPEQKRAALAEHGIPENVQGMDTAKSLDNVNNRVKHRENQSGQLSDEDYDGLKRENGSHGETKATSDALDRIEADPPEGQGRKATPADLEDLELHNQRIPAGQQTPPKPDAFQRCDFCRGNTDGVQPTPDLANSERAIDQNIANDWDK
jgi:RHS repeat-associated protein